MRIKLGTVAALALMPPDARQMAAAPPAEKKAPALGILTGLFGAPIFKPSDSSKVNENERTKVRSKKLANVTIPINVNGKDSGFYCKGSIYADLAPGQTKPTVRFTFFGANMQSSVGTDTDAARQSIDAHKAQWAVDYSVFRKANPSQIAAVAANAVVLEDEQF